jgi:hypothetical protein
MPLSFGVRAASGIPRDAAFACACQRKAVPRSTSSRLVTAVQNILSASAALREYFTLPVGYGRQVNELGMRPAEWSHQCAQFSMRNTGTCLKQFFGLHGKKDILFNIDVNR